MNEVSIGHSAHGTLLCGQMVILKEVAAKYSILGLIYVQSTQEEGYWLRIVFFYFMQSSPHTMHIKY